MAGRRSPKNPAISRLTWLLEEITSSDRRSRHTESQHNARRHQTFSGKTVWEGVVYTFSLSGHATARRAYAWSSPIEGSDKRRFFAVLHQWPVTSPVEAVAGGHSGGTEKGVKVMADTPIMSQCFICKRPFKYGPHIYNGRRITKWDMMICSRCPERNWEGIVPEKHPDLIPYLKSRGIQMKLNARGWIDWPS
jgi:hypothetical protein